MADTRLYAAGVPAEAVRSRATVDLTSLRPAGALMLAIAAAAPVLPVSPGLPCPLRAVTGIPCPLCGMTTSVTAVVHFDLPGALAANPAGVVAVVVAVVLLVVRGWASVDVPRWSPFALLAGMWLFELQRFDIV